MRDEGLSTLTIAHLSDVHLSPIPRPAWRDLTPKRLAGLANWHRGRKHRHRSEVLDLLLADLERQAADHIVVTGDLCNIGIPGEMAAAVSWLERLGPPDRVTVVPGNHDTYVRLRGDPGLARWQAYMAGTVEGAARRRHEANAFPFVRRLGAVALVGLSSAVPTPVFRATGKLGDAQLAATRHVLRQLGEEGLVRVVLIHHPPLPGVSQPAHRLVDAEAFHALIGDTGAELILHGHHHRAMISAIASRGGDVPVVGVPSASHDRHHRHAEPARYNLYRIDRSGGDLRITMQGRALAGVTGVVATVETRELTVGARSLASRATTGESYD